MILLPVRVTDRGNIQKERLLFRARYDGEIGSLAVFGTLSKGAPVAGPFQGYWFPDTTVNQGDFVVLYTKAGIPTLRERADGRSNHFLYWGKTSPLWTQRLPVLVEVDSWEAIQPG